ncbi:MAG: hypothetical protein GF401_05325 [Chitinivibrionales bacterium]|nr:hypothetical protein [Chitinivibrionales bacterium]
MSMGGIYFLLPALLAIFISFLVVRAAAIMLMMTGLDQRRAQFQALSAFSGTGFTTKEAETVVNHPARRKIITRLIILGNAGLATIIVTATSSLVTSQGFAIPLNVVVLLIGIFIIYKIATRQKFVEKWESFIERRIIKASKIEEGAIEDLLHLMEGYSLVKAIMTENAPFVNSSLAECRLNEQGLLILGIEREKKWIPIPTGSEIIQNGDKIVVYGPLKILREKFSEHKSDSKTTREFSSVKKEKK